MSAAEETTAPGVPPIVVVHVTGNGRRWTSVERAGQTSAGHRGRRRRPGGVARVYGPRKEPGQEIVFRVQAHHRRHSVGHAQSVQRLE